MKLLFSRKFICVKKQDFYIKRQLSYKNIFCKKTAFFQSRFLQKYISVKKQFFYKRAICKKAAFLQQYILVKKQYFYNHSICKKIAFLHRRFFTRTVFYATYTYLNSQSLTLVVLLMQRPQTPLTGLFPVCFCFLTLRLRCKR